MKLTPQIALAILLTVSAADARAADVASLSCLDTETPADIRNAIIAMMRASDQDAAATPGLAKIRDEAAAARDRCRARYQWSDAAASHAQMAFIAKLGMAFTRPPVSEAGFDPDRVTVATRALSAAQREALRMQDQKALAAFMAALNAAGVFPKTYQQGVIIGAFAGYSVAYDEGARLFALD